MNEFELISTWFEDLGCSRPDVHLGVGDDAALITLGHDQELLTTSACEIYQTSMPPEQFANNCYEQALQALLKQHATPAWAVLCLCLGDVELDWPQRFATGLFECLQGHDVQLIGGDTTAGATQVTLFLSGYRSRSAA